VADGYAVRVDGQVAIDSVARGAGDVRAHAFVVDSTMRVREIAAGTARVHSDTARFTLFGSASGADGVYSLEALEPTSKLAARARFTFAPLPTGEPGAPRLSDIVVAQPFGGLLPTSRADPRLRGRSSLLLEPTETIGVYAEASALDVAGGEENTFDVELTMQRLDSPAALTSAVRWLGRVFGRSERSAGARVAWRANAPAQGPAVIAVDVSLATLRPGLYDLTLLVRAHAPWP
jgi:hypothetical protein